MKRIHCRLPATFLFFIGCTLLAGCSSGGGATAESKKAVDSVRSTRQELAKAKVEAQHANVALERLASGGNIEQNYKAFSKEVTEIQSAGERARARAADMRERQRQYIMNWEKEMDQVSSPELKAGAQQRRATVKENYDQIMADAHATRDAYQPYLRDLQDIQRALASDLTPAGIEAATPAMNKAKAEGQTLQERLDVLIARLDDMSGSMSSATAKPASK